MGCGLDEGKFYLFDARQRIREAAFYIDTKKEDMFTHERYNDFNLLVGYGDGEFKHIDIRQANKMYTTQNTLTFESSQPYPTVHIHLTLFLLF